MQKITTIVEVTTKPPLQAGHHGPDDYTYTAPATSGIELRIDNIVVKAVQVQLHMRTYGPPEILIDNGRVLYPTEFWVDGVLRGFDRGLLDDWRPL